MCSDNLLWRTNFARQSRRLITRQPCQEETLTEAEHPSEQLCTQSTDYPEDKGICEESRFRLFQQVGPPSRFFRLLTVAYA